MNFTQINFLINLKNNSLRGKEFLVVKYHSSLVSLVEFLYAEGLIQSFNIKDMQISVNLRYFHTSLFKNLKIISKPSFKKAVSAPSLCTLPIKNSIFCFSTRSGLHNLAVCKKAKQGGLLFFTA